MRRPPHKRAIASLPLTFLILTLAQTTQAARLNPLSRQVCPVVLPNDPPSSRFLLPIPQPSTSSFRTATRQPRIVGGDFISPNLQRFMAYLTPATSDSICTGSVLSAFWVLTAAHCGTTTSWSVTVGESQAFTGGDRLPIAAVFTHPNFIPNRADLRAFDVTLVQLAVAAPTTSFVRLNVNPLMPEPTSFSRVMGYGVTVFEDQEPASTRFRLRQVDVPVTTFAFCRSVYGRGVRDDAQLCAGYERGGCDSCQGDSGGPIIQYDDEGNAVQMGTVSFGAGCAQPNTPGVYVRTSFHTDWFIAQGAEFTESSNTRAVFSASADSQPTSSSATTDSPETATTDTGSGVSIVPIAGGIVAALALVVVIVGTTFVISRRRRANAEHTSPDADVTVSTSSLTPPPPTFHPPPPPSSGPPPPPLPPPPPATPPTYSAPPGYPGAATSVPPPFELQQPVSPSIYPAQYASIETPLQTPVGFQQAYPYAPVYGASPPPPSDAH